MCQIRQKKTVVPFTQNFSLRFTRRCHHHYICMHKHDDDSIRRRCTSRRLRLRASGVRLLRLVRGSDKNAGDCPRERQSGRGMFFFYRCCVSLSLCSSSSLEMHRQFGFHRLRRLRRSDDDDDL